MVAAPRQPSVRRALAEIRSRLRKLETRRNVGASTIRGGRLTIVDADGNVVALLGTAESGDTGFFVFRPDGSSSFYAWTSAGGFSAIFDHANHYIVTEDTTSGQGLARPYIPLGPMVSNSAPTDMTMSTVWNTLQIGQMYKQHPGLLVPLVVQSTLGSTGQIRLLDDVGRQIGPTLAVAANEFSVRNDLIGAVEGTHMNPTGLNLQARRTGGTGAIGVRAINVIGIESQLL